MAYQPSKEKFGAIKASQSNETASCHLVFLQPANHFVMRKWGEFVYKPNDVSVPVPQGDDPASFENAWSNNWSKP